MGKLQTLEEKFPDLQSQDSPTQQVGGEPRDELGVESVEAALTGALTAIERQVRERRERLGATWQRPDEVTDQGVYELTAREIYDTYSEQIAQTNLNNLDRNAIASQLMLNEGLDQETAYYVAYQILHVAQE